MKVKIENLVLCDDCLLPAVNGDYSHLDYYYNEMEAGERMTAIDSGLDLLGPNLVPDFDSETGDGIAEFSTRTCDCCETRLAGQRHRFAVLSD